MLDLGVPAWHKVAFGAHGAQRSVNDVMLDALGEMRTFMAKNLWLDVDVYHHAMEGRGIAFKDEEIMPLLKVAHARPQL